MANIRRQTVPTLPASAVDGNATIGRHAAFASVYWANQLVGLMENINCRQTNGTSYRGSLGTDWNEKVRGQRAWGGTISRGAVRTQDIIQLHKGVYPNVRDLDFSVLDFDLKLEYDYESVTGLTTYEQISWVIHTVTITDYEFSFAGPYELEMENCTFIAKGWQLLDGNGNVITENANELWGTGGQKVPATGATAPPNYTGGYSDPTTGGTAPNFLGGGGGGGGLGVG